MIEPESVAMGPAREGDCEFAFRVKKAAEGALITSVFGWDEEFERRFHLDEWNARKPDIISYEGEPVGTVSVLRGKGFIEIGRFFILPEFQNRGIGSCVLARLVEEADRAGLVSRLRFLKGNRAESLYLRHAFALVAEDEKFRTMERKPFPPR